MVRSCNLKGLKIKSTGRVQNIEKKIILVYFLQCFSKAYIFIFTKLKSYIRMLFLRESSIIRK